MIDVLWLGGVGINENTTSVLEKVLSDCNTAGYGTSLIDLLDHVGFTSHVTVLANSVHIP